MKDQNPTSATSTADQKKQAIRLIPTQKTFTFLIITPSFIIDYFINKWLASLVVDKGVTPMLGKVSEGTFTIHYTYLFTTKVEMK